MTLTSDSSSSDSPPKHVNVGAINPFALCEAILGQHINREQMSSAHTIATVLQSEYSELFDMKHNSVLYAGLKLDSKSKSAERLNEKDIHTLTEDDLVTPDMSKVRKIGDLSKIGLEDINEAPVKLAWIQNGQLRLVLHPSKFCRKLSNRDITQSLRDTVTPFRKGKEGKEEWSPPNSTWESPSETARRIHQLQNLRGGIEGEMKRGVFHLFGDRTNSYEAMMRHEYDNPVQGAVGNSWLIAALFAVAWSNPFTINRSGQFLEISDEKHKGQKFAIKLYSKGGENDADTSTIEVNYDIPMNNSTNMPMYCHPSGSLNTIWPALYEKAFAKWLTGSKSDHPDITQLSPSARGGDPVKAMAQITDYKPHYYFTDSRSGADLIGVVRANSTNFKTIRPMVAYTHASGDVYKGCNLVANHAYTVLGWAFPGGSRQYFVLRNPWGFTEAKGLTSYPGLLDTIDPDFWPPAHLVDRRGVFALEASAFQQYFACLGMCK